PVVRLQNSIVWGSSSGINCNAPVTDGGNNLQYPDNTCGSTIPVTDPQLSPLADNGGPTQTMALQKHSPAIDAGDNAACAAAPINNLDQRSVARPIDGNEDRVAICDIGAFEAPAFEKPSPTPKNAPTFVPSR